MYPIKWMIPVVCAGGALLAQTTNDINGLTAAAAHFVSSGMAGAHDPETMGLCKISGNYSPRDQDVLMTRATDVQHWTFTYRLGTRPLPPDAQGQDGQAADPQAPETPRHTGVTAQCTQGVFGEFHYLQTPITRVKSLEYTWVAVSLDNAIAALNANGYIRGFTKVDVMRPDVEGWPDDFVYVFHCPMERREVAISCQNGNLAWTYGY